MKDPWQDEQAIARFDDARRSVEELCPALHQYLKRGARVLDVGCSSGRLSRQVARLVAPGKLTGIDPAQAAIQRAEEEAAAEGVANATYAVGDTYALDFKDDTFDLTYSNDVAVWLSDPVRALREQRRVTKPGGYVAVQMSDYGNILWYPPTPNIDRYLAALGQIRDWPEEERMIDTHQARRALEIMDQAGFKTTEINGWTKVVTRESPVFETQYLTWRNIWLNPDGNGQAIHRRLMARSLTDAALYEAARAELDAWYASPYAVYLQARFLVVGRVA